MLTNSSFYYNPYPTSSFNEITPSQLSTSLAAEEVADSDMTLQARSKPIVFRFENCRHPKLRFTLLSWAATLCNACFWIRVTRRRYDENCAPFRFPVSLLLFLYTNGCCTECLIHFMRCAKSVLYRVMVMKQRGIHW